MNTNSYRGISDEQLVALIQSGDYAPFSVLIDRYMPYIVKASSKYKSVIETEDLVSEGLGALFSAVKAYKMQKSPFKVFAHLCIDRAVLAEYRCFKALKRIPPQLVSSIEDIDVAGSVNPESLIIEKESLKNLMEFLKGELSGLEYQVFREFIRGKCYKEIADVTGKSEKSVDNALRRARGKLSELKINT